MIKKIKDLFYFPFASYFRFFAKIRLKRWNPKIIVVTGSSGKTTLLHLLQSQIGEKAKYSIKANSSFGIPFDILDFRRETLTLLEWPKLFFLTPFRAFRKAHKERIYFAEVDCDRPGEGDFLGAFLKPDVTLWISSSKTHSMNFDKLVREKLYPSVEESIKSEFAKVAKHTKKLVLINDNIILPNKLKDEINANIKRISCKGRLSKYEVKKNGTTFIIDSTKINFAQLLPQITCISLLMTFEALKYLGIEKDLSFSSFGMPPGRSAVFRGRKNTVLVDSSYNANLDSMTVILETFALLKGEKWIVLGDMLEQGESEKEEHKKLAKLVLKYNFQRVLLMGPRVSKYTYPLLEDNNIIVQKFLKPTEVLNYLRTNIKGKETILFKGARFLEGVIENLLVDKKDAKKLARREKIWEIRRKKWGL